MKTAIIYFSGTGNTKWAAETFRERILSAGYDCTLFDIEKDKTTDFSSYESILIAHPIYGANIPPILVNRIKKCVFSTGTHISVLATFGYVNALGPFRESRQIGLSIYSYFNLKMFNNISTPRLKSKILSIDIRKSRKEKITMLIQVKADLFIAGKRRREGIGPYLIPGIIIGRLSYRKIRENHKALSVGNECTQCMQCVKNCPAEAITFENNNFIFKNTCTSCMRCYNNCPVSAICINGQYADPSVYRRYTGPWHERHK